MLLAEAPNLDVTVGTIEGALTAILFAVSFLAPRLGASWFRRIEHAFSRFARHKKLTVATVGASLVLLRLAMLPIVPIPLPFVPDDFSFLLAADTFLHGRLANPTPAMWTHFESIHVSMQPTYGSMYFPAQGLLLAAGKVIFGHPWFALLLVSALMCAALCWMLQAWLPPAWALLGGIVAVLHLGLFSYWTNTYHAAGSICALGGALVLGALPRLIKTARFRYFLLIGAGVAILVLARPYEGFLLCLPVAWALLDWAVRGKNRPSVGGLIWRAAPALALIAAAIAWLGYYDDRAFGKPTTLPYTVNRATYAMAPYFVWQSPRPEPHYRYAAMRAFYYVGEQRFFSAIHTISGFLPQTLVKVLLAFFFFAGWALLPPLIMVRRVFLDRRIRFLLVCVLVMAAGMVIEIYLLPHYLAPFTAAFYALGLQTMRHLRVWKPEGNPAGLAIARVSLTVCVLMAGARLYAGPLHLALHEFPPADWNFAWYGPDHFGTERAAAESRLNQQPGKQLVLVRYSALHNPLNEWVYNSADIDNSKVVWAREMSNSADNQELLRYYRDRTVWLARADGRPATIEPYPGVQSAASH